MHALSGDGDASALDAHAPLCLLDLPDEVLRLILWQLDPASVYCCNLICKRIALIISEQYFWEQLCLHHNIIRAPAVDARALARTPGHPAAAASAGASGSAALSLSGAAAAASSSAVAAIAASAGASTTASPASFGGLDAALLTAGSCLDGDDAGGAGGAGTASPVMRARRQRESDAFMILLESDGAHAHDDDNDPSDAAEDDESRAWMANVSRPSPPPRSQQQRVSRSASSSFVSDGSAGGAVRRRARSQASAGSSNGESESGSSAPGDATPADADAPPNYRQVFWGEYARRWASVRAVRQRRARANALIKMKSTVTMMGNVVHALLLLSAALLEATILAIPPKVDGVLPFGWGYVFFPLGLAYVALGAVLGLQIIGGAIQSGEQSVYRRHSRSRSDLGAPMMYSAWGSVVVILVMVVVGVLAVFVSMLIRKVGGTFDSSWVQVFTPLWLLMIPCGMAALVVLPVSILSADAHLHVLRDVSAALSVSLLAFNAILTPLKLDGVVAGSWWLVHAPTWVSCLLWLVVVPGASALRGNLAALAADGSPMVIAFALGVSMVLVSLRVEWALDDALPITLCVLPVMVLDAIVLWLTLVALRDAAAKLNLGTHLRELYRRTCAAAFDAVADAEPESSDGARASAT